MNQNKPKSSELLGCERCGHTDVLPAGPDGMVVPAKETVYHCDVCRARIAFGELIPRTLPLLHPTNPRLMILKFDALTVPLDPEFALELADELRSMAAALLQRAPVWPGRP